MKISRVVAEYLLDQLEEDIAFGLGARRKLAMLAKAELTAELAQLQHTPIRFQFREHPAYPAAREIWILGGAPVEVDTPSQIAFGLHVLAFAASCPRCHVPLRVIDPTLAPGQVDRARVAVSNARDFIGANGGGSDLIQALSRVKLHDDATASFWPAPSDAALILNPV